MENNKFDAIVIGYGITGGWAAKELCEKGLKTLVKERGRNVQHSQNYPTAIKEIWEFEFRNELHPNVIKNNPILSRCYAFEAATEHFFVKDDAHPYIQKKHSNWIKGYQVGGKSLMWARMTLRWIEKDFKSNKQDGHSVDWPIRYKDLAPWYSYVEKLVGIQGNRNALKQIPDGDFLPANEMNIVEKHFKKSVESKYPGRNVVVSGFIPGTIINSANIFFSL